MSVKKPVIIVISASLFILSVYLLTSNKVGTWNNSKDEVTRKFSQNNDHKLAVIVPYRGAFGELQIFIPKVSAFLNHNKIQHKFYVIRQADSMRFNKGSLINVGYVVSRDECDYLAIHDIDTIPLNPELNYEYPANGPHLLSPREYHPAYNGSKFSGGIILITMKHFKQVGGLTNKYWGWGGEDNEFYSRMLKSGLPISKSERLSTNKSNTFMNIHDVRLRPRDQERFNAIKTNVFKIHKDSGFWNVQYEIQSVIPMSILNVAFNVYNVELFCEDLDGWCH